MRRTHLIVIAAALAAAWTGGCKDEASGQSLSTSKTFVDPGADDPTPVTRAIAVLHPTEGYEVRGTVTFVQARGALQVETRLRGVPAGAHAYHIHLFGDCSAADGASAGTHFNLAGSSLDPPEDIDRITGNLGDLVPDEDGEATASTTLDGASLHGRYALLGRSVVVHVKGNDPSSPPIGAAGGRIACGVIGIDEAP